MSWPNLQRQNRMDLGETLVPRHAFAPDKYAELLEEKRDRTQSVFSRHLDPLHVAIEVFPRCVRPWGMGF
jgi:hypothetical protein